MSLTLARGFDAAISTQNSDSIWSFVSLFLGFHRISVVADGREQKSQGGQPLLAIHDEIRGYTTGDGYRPVNR